MALFLAALLPLLSGCQGDPESDGSARNAGKTKSSATCPPAENAQARWPTGVPAGLPVPAGLRVTDQRRQGDVLVIRFTTALPLSDAATLIVKDLPEAGFELRGGDAEGDEIDQPFSTPGYRGAFKLSGVADCRTDGTLAVTRAR